MTDLSERRLTRRSLFHGAAGTGALLIAGRAAAQQAETAGTTALKGNINHSVARWTYGDLPLDQLAALCNRIGIGAIDLCGPDDWPVLKEAGLDSSMCNGAEISLEDGWAERDNHPVLIDNYRRHIQLVADAGYRNLICFSGNRRGMDPEDGLRACEEGIKEILGAAEEAGVVIQMELLNSKVDHPDYLCDNSPWGVALCDRIGSPNFKLLYDIYHMQIMEGDVIRTITDHQDCFGHYHTAGNPGRHEPDDSQELNYAAICRAIRDTGFTGYVAQEFVPSADQATDAAAEALRAAVLTCDV
ncbi:hydroxypyruvate isomerase [Paracoccus isoporae]|uniref:Hydroxypyruvate isomerase n=1 Tax=Paracoccus isoporae TaxID=591205 RepID=A0A1G7FBI6_9RHOB|nr:TIM barrel protein [Paracoccus isoporae]SDE73280.1 hydroxypyruvate isomerase [Paracoccus isoporae]